MCRLSSNLGASYCWNHPLIYRVLLLSAKNVSFFTQSTAAIGHKTWRWSTSSYRFLSCYFNGILIIIIIIIIITIIIIIFADRTTCLLLFNTLYRASLIILCYDQQMHNYFTNYRTLSCFVTTVSSSESSQ